MDNSVLTFPAPSSTGALGEGMKVRVQPGSGKLCDDTELTLTFSETPGLDTTSLRPVSIRFFVADHHSREKAAAELDKNFKRADADVSARQKKANDSRRKIQQSIKDCRQKIKQLQKKLQIDSIETPEEAKAEVERLRKEFEDARDQKDRPVQVDWRFSEKCKGMPGVVGPVAELFVVRDWALQSSSSSSTSPLPLCFALAALARGSETR